MRNENGNWRKRTNENAKKTQVSDIQGLLALKLNLCPEIKKKKIGGGLGSIDLFYTYVGKNFSINYIL